ncbi:PREDICTED: 60S ribosome subunit biogenesis protein NIP7 homolog [Amphimedon queenslandica]|uniref:60S ribosome subunit biogenesis protein NIP7 homolog n=1 Tax=Amphimedon queenslandica TaxID=400682 RepID=A0A1X7UGY3_AMPQE|nr:PREDICTED: 60S ribosome subunit biogenesis protein NIP7 homolog [Amphimedon queenslandica]|eukprot:XP_003387869.1 PREDICTED: 60S ribosome subunit biogenesis protein NIP7 homolog [Amphimedon queenslandica]
MRPLTEEETKVVLGKLSKYIGDNVKLLVDRPDGSYVFRLHKNRVFYVKEQIMRWATNVARKQMLSLGTCIGKFTHGGKFHLVITALDILAPHAKHKVWLKANSEQQFLYGHNVLKGGLGRITENTPTYQGVLVYSMNDTPLGFGVAAKSTQDCRHIDPGTTVVFNQADIGQYLRSEDQLS